MPISPLAGKPLPADKFRDDILVIGMPLTEICNATYSDPRQRQLFKNIIYLGALAALMDLEPGAIAELIGEQYGHQMKQAGWLVPALIMLLILQISFVVERLLSLNKAQGRGSLPDFLNNVRKKLHNNDVDGAIQLCGQQRGSAANVMEYLGPTATRAAFARRRSP